MSQNSEAQLFRKITKVGTTAASFLKIPAGARSIAMGSSGVAMEGDVYSIYLNPGALSRIKNSGETSFNHAEWLADISYDFVASTLTLGDFGTIGVSITSLSVPQDIVRTVLNPEGNGKVWDAGSLALGVSFARNLTDRFSIGFSAKYVNESIYNMSASGFAVDIGTIYTTELSGLKIGASISNFGSKMKLDGTDNSFDFNPPDGQLNGSVQNVKAQYKTDLYDMPLMFRIGISMDAVQTESIRATVALDASHPNDNVEYVNSGVEIAFEEMFFGRVGYKSLFLQDSEEGLTWGVGINVGLNNTTGMKLDYAYADYGRLKNVQYVTIGITY